VHKYQQAVFSSKEIKRWPPAQSFGVEGLKGKTKLMAQV
jgi:hypothetical protein